MSKESTHLHFAARLADSFDTPESDSKDLAALLGTFDQALLWGSVSPDVFYYGLSSRLDALSENLHRPGAGSARARALEMLCRACETGHGELFAFALGLVSHIVHDAWLHPAVRVYSGPDEDPESIYRHRLIETWLAWRESPDWTVSRRLAPAAGEGLAGFRLLAPEVPRPRLRRTLRRFAAIHRLLDQAWLHWFLKLAAPLSRRRINRLQGLMNRHLNQAAPELSPELETDIRRRQERALAMGRDLFRTCRQAFRGLASTHELDRALPEHSLNDGFIDLQTPTDLQTPCQTREDGISFSTPDTNSQRTEAIT